MGENLATCRIEHIFGFVEGAMNGSLVRSIGMMRAKAANALTNLVYNIFRYVHINHYKPHIITSKVYLCPYVSNRQKRHVNEWINEHNR